MVLVLDAKGNELLRVRMTQAAPQSSLQSILQDQQASQLHTFLLNVL